MDEKENLISSATAAKQLNVSRTTLSRLVTSGRLGAYRIGHRTLFDQQMLDEFKVSVLQPASSLGRGHGDAEAQPK